jgi:DNA repair exonuclease SbcCD ATPase subunit
MIFTDLEVQNFLSIEHVKLHLRNRGLCLIVGNVVGSDAASSNGAGKSNIFVEAINWLFYDRLTRANKHTKVRRRLNKEMVAEDARVRLTGVLDDGRPFEFIKSDLSGYKISVDGESLTPYSKTDGPNRLLELHQMNSQIFNSIVMMGQGFPTRFSGFDDSIRTTIIERFIDANVYVDAQNRAEKNFKLLRDQGISLNSRIEALIGSVNATGEQYLAASTRLQTLESEISTRTDQINAEIFSIQTAEEKLSVQENGISSEILNCKSLLAEKRKESEELRIDIHNIKSKSDTLRAQIQSIKDRLSLIDSLGDVCDRCSQKIDKSLLQKQRLESTEQLYKLSSEYEQLNVEGKKEQYARMIDGIVSITESLTRKESHLSSIKYEKEIISNRRYNLEKEKEKLSVSKLPLEAALKDLSVRLEKEKSEIGDANTKLSHIRYRSPYLEWWIEGFSVRGIRSWRLDEIIQSVNKCLIDYCRELFDGELLVKLTTEKPTKTSTKPVVYVQVESNCGNYDLESGGRQRRIDVAIHMALRAAAAAQSGKSNTNILVCDETLDFIDPYGVDRTLSVLQNTTESIFLISHDSRLQNRIHNTITVQMDKDVTCLIDPISDQRFR